MISKILKISCLSLVLITIFVTFGLTRPYFHEHLLDGNAMGTAAIFAVDLDNDGDRDVVGALLEESAMVWWRNDGGNPIVWSRYTIGSSFGAAGGVYAAYIDNDNLYDVLGTARAGNEIAWWHNGGVVNDTIQWTKHSIRTGYNLAHEVYTHDFDEDGDNDVFSVASLANLVTWWRNDGGYPVAWTEETIDDNFEQSKSIHVGDFNGDDTLDVVGAAIFGDNINWWRNDGLENGSIQWTEFTIDNNFQGGHRVQAVDLDGDGDKDVLGAAYLRNEIAWWRNDGPNTSGIVTWSKQVIGTNFIQACIAYAVDLDGDEDKDIVGTAQNGDELAIWYNDGPENEFIHWTKVPLDDLVRVWPAYACDLDNDGDNDILAASGWQGTNEVKWYENMGETYLVPDFQAEPVTGHATLLVQFTETSIANPPAISWAWDFDNDGSIDSNEQNPVAVYENPGDYTVSLTVTSDSLSQTTTRENYIHAFDGRSALLFEGGVATCPAEPELNLIYTVTIEASIKPLAWAEIEAIVDKSNISFLLNGEGSPLNDHSLAVWLSTVGSAPGFIHTPENSLILDDCRHVALTYDGYYSEVKLYIDGLDQEPLDYYGGQPAGFIDDNSIIDLFIGNSVNLNWPFQGIIDEVRVWDVVRSAEEIMTNMDTSLNGDEPGLVAYWQMNEGNGSLIFDGSSNGNNAILDGATWVNACDAANAIEDDRDLIENLPPGFSLGQNYPNPWFLNRSKGNPVTTIAFALPRPANLKLKIYDVSGRLIKTLSNNKMWSAGHNSIDWNGKDEQGRQVSSGVYFYKMETEEFSETKRMLLLK